MKKLVVAVVLALAVLGGTVAIAFSPQPAHAEPCNPKCKDGG